jgi:hypothetical protein
MLFNSPDAPNGAHDIINPKEVVAADATTKQALVDKVAERTAGKPLGWDGARCENLWLYTPGGDPDTYKFNLWDYDPERRYDKEGNEVTALVVRMHWDGDVTQVSTAYTFSRGPGELLLVDRHHVVRDESAYIGYGALRLSQPDPRLSPERQAVQMGMELVQHESDQMRARADAREQEALYGLDPKFFSQAEAEQLLVQIALGKPW